MNNSEDFDDGLLKAPRWLQIPIGILLVPLALVSLIGSIGLIIAPSPEVDPVITTVAGTILALVCLWAFTIAFRLIFSRPNKSGGLVTPFVLRVSAILFFTLPVAALFFGSYYRERGAIAIMQGVIYLLVAMRLWSLARIRTR